MTLIDEIEEVVEEIQEEQLEGYNFSVLDYTDEIENKIFVRTHAKFMLYKVWPKSTPHQEILSEIFSIWVDRDTTKEDIRSLIKSNIAKILLSPQR